MSTTRNGILSFSLSQQKPDTGRSLKCLADEGSGIECRGLGGYTVTTERIKEREEETWNTDRQRTKKEILGHSKSEESLKTTPRKYINLKRMTSHMLKKLKRNLIVEIGKCIEDSVLGPDGVPAIFLKKTSKLMAKSMMLSRQSLDDSSIAEVPTKWVMCPQYTKEDPSCY